MRKPRTLLPNIILLGGLLCSPLLALSKAVPNPQPDPRITPAPAHSTVTPAYRVDTPLVKRQQTLQDLCGANFQQCDATHCCKQGQYCYPDVINYVWMCQDLTQFSDNLDDYYASLSAILGSLTQYGLDYSLDLTGLFGPNPSGNSNANNNNKDNTPSSSRNSANNSGNNSNSSSGGLSKGAIIGIVVVVLLVLLAVGAGILICCFKRRKRRQAKPLLNPSGAPNVGPGAIPQTQPYIPPMAQQQPIPQHGAAAGYYSDPSKQPFLQGQEPAPYATQITSPHPHTLQQYQQYPPYGYPVQSPPPGPPYYAPQPPREVPQGVVEAGGEEKKIVTPKVKSSSNITPIPSLVPLSSGHGGGGGAGTGTAAGGTQSQKQRVDTSEGVVYEMYSEYRKV